MNREPRVDLLGVGRTGDGAASDCRGCLRGERFAGEKAAHAETDDQSAARFQKFAARECGNLRGFGSRGGFAHRATSISAAGRGPGEVWAWVLRPGPAAR